MRPRLRQFCLNSVCLLTVGLLFSPVQLIWAITQHGSVSAESRSEVEPETETNQQIGVDAVVDISFQQTSNAVIVSASANTGTIDKNSWKYLKTADYTEPACDASDNYPNSGRETDSLGIPIDARLEHNRWICVKVKNSLGHWSYGKHRISYSDPGPAAVYNSQASSLEPEATPQQAVIKQQASATASACLSVSYSSSTATVSYSSAGSCQSGTVKMGDCSTSSSTWTTRTSMSVSNTSHNKSICAQVTYTYSYSYTQSRSRTLYYSSTYDAGGLCSGPSLFHTGPWSGWSNTSSLSQARGSNNQEDEAKAAACDCDGDNDGIPVCSLVTTTSTETENRTRWSSGTTTRSYTGPKLIFYLYTSIQPGYRTASLTSSSAAGISSKIIPGASSCNATSYGSGTDYLSSAKRDFSFADSGSRVCFKATSSVNSQLTNYAGLAIGDLQPQTEIVSDDNRTAVAAVVNEHPFFYDSLTTYYSKVLDKSCNKTNYSASTSPAVKGLFRGLADISNGSNVCFKITISDNGQEFSYYIGRQLAGLVSAQITISQNDHKLKAEVFAGQSASWRWVRKNPATGCNAQTDFTTSPNGSSSSVTLTSADNQKKYCFKSTNSLNQSIYNSYLVDLTKPTVSLSQINRTVSAGGSGLAGYQWFKSTSDPDCSSSASQWADSTKHTTGNPTTSLADNDWVCFRGKNSRQVYGYAELEVDYNLAPVIDLIQSGDKIKISDHSLISGEQYLTGSTASYSCNSGSGSSWSSGVQTATETSSLTDGTWACFRGKNSNNVYGYAKLKLNLKPPVISISQYQTIVRASSSDRLDSTTWKYEQGLTGSTCDSSVTIDDGSSGLATVSAANDNRQYICFTVKNNRGVAGYASWRVDFDPPLVQISSNQFGHLVASSNSSDLPLNPVWKHTPASSSSSCSRPIVDNPLHGNVAQDSQNYCFQVTDKAGNLGYGYQSRSAPAIILKQTGHQVQVEKPATGLVYTTSSSYSGANYRTGTTISGNWMAVGSYVSGNGRIYLFKLDDGSKKWQLQQIINGYNSRSIDLNGDYLAVGAPYDDGASGSDTGAVYIFKRTGNTWTLQQEIVDKSSGNGFDNLRSSDYFGWSVSVNGDRLAVGAYGDDTGGSKAGTVYVFKRTGAVWALEEEIADGEILNGTAFNNLRSYDYFGYSVSLTSDRLAVGAYGDDTGGSGAGTVYVFKRTGTVWALEKEIAKGADLNGTAFNNLRSSDYFGWSVSLTSDRLAVGAYGDDTGGSGAGTVYVFKWTGTVWALEKEIADGADLNGTTFNNLRSGDYFGWSLSLNGDRLAVGAYGDDGAGSCYSCGAVYVFKRTATSWALEQEISDKVAIDTVSSQDYSYLGRSVSLSGKYLLTVENYNGYTSGSLFGSAHLFKLTGSTWQTDYSTDPMRSAVNSDSPLALGANDDFGYSVSQSGDYLAVGSDNETVYIFQRNLNHNPDWQLIQRLTPDQVQYGDQFGWSVSLAGDYLAVGAYGDNGASGSDTGAVYVFKRTGTVWTLQQEIIDQSSGFNNLRSGDYFGRSVSLTSDRLAVGAYGDDTGGSGAGTVYVFKRTGTVWALEEEIADGEILNGTAFNNLRSYDYFGYSVSLTSDRLAVGAYGDDTGGSGAGTVYVFKRTGTVWALEEEIADGEILNGTAFNNLRSGDYFGWTVSLTSDRLAVGAYGDDTGGSGAGTVYVFKRAGAVWALEKEIADGANLAGVVFNDLTNGDYFGYSVSLTGDRLAVGAYGDNGAGGSDTGAVYIFKRTATSWALEQAISDQSSGFNSLKASDYFGRSVSLTANHLAVGADGDDGASGSATGAVYGFSLTTGGWDWLRPQQLADQGNRIIYNYQAKIASSPACSGGSYKRTGNQLSITSQDNFKYVCIRAQNLADQTATGVIQINLDPTPISLRQSWGQVFASGANLGDFAYFTDNSNPTCDQTNSSNYTQAAKTTSLTNGTWVCFKATNSRGITSYRKLKVETAVSSQSQAGAGASLTKAKAGGGQIASSQKAGSSQYYSSSGQMIVYITSDSDFPAATTKSVIINSSTCNATNYTAGSDLQTGTIRLVRLANHGQYVCFKGTTKYSQAIKISFGTGHRVNIVYDSQRQLVIAGSSGSRISYKNRLISQSVCNQTTFNYLLGAATVVQKQSRQLKAADKNKIACFELTIDGDRFYGGSYPIKASTVKVAISQNDHQLTASTASPGTFNWQWVRHTSAGDCSQTTDFNQSPGGNGRQITLKTADDDQYFCFRASDSNHQTGYGQYQVDLTPPAISFNQVNSGQTATVTASSTASLKPNTWKYEKGLTSSACSSSTTIDDGSSNTATVTYAADNNKYVCFSVKNDVQITGYGSYQVDFPPKITVSQNNTTLTAAADTSDTDLPATPVWKKTSGLGLEPNCANVASNKWSSGQTVSNAAHNKWYCFSVVDEASQTGYGKFKAIINPPTISFSQDQDSVDARATIVADTIETTSWQNFKTTTSTAPACSAANNSLFTVSPGASQNSVTISASENNYWACFRVKNSRGVHGYNKHQIDYNAPAIIVNQAGTTLTASSTDSDLPATPVWQKAGPTDTANCSSATTGFSSGKAITSVTAGKYYCFKVTDTAGNSGYQSAQASTVTPVISFSRTSSKIRVSATTAIGSLKTNSWGYFKTTDSQEPDCDANDSYTTWPHSVSSFDYTINSGDVNKWLCVRVQNSYNNWGYNKIRIDLTAPTVTVSQTGTTLTGSTDATDLPASPVWQHSNAHNTAPACSGAIAYNSGQTKTGALHNKYYCFKVTDRSGNTGYASIRVDATVPTVTVRQHQTTVFGLATTHNVAGQNLSIDDIVQNFGGDAFGLDGDRMAVGARRVGGHSGANTGAVYLFEKVNGLWQLEQALKDEASGFTELDANDQFGYSVSLEGDRLAVGVPFDDYSGTGNSGSVYIFHHNGSNWILEQELSKQTTGLTDLNSEATFGASVNLSGDTSRLVVGADGYSNGSNNYYQRIGAVYVFKRTGTSWSLEQKIDKNTRDLNIGHGDWFGVQVAIDGDYMAVGAYGDDGAGGSDAGAVHMFRRTGNSWSFYQEISDSASRSPEFTDLGGDDKFGFAMDIDGDRMIIGAPGVSQPTTGRWYKHGKRYLSNPGGATGYYISGACSNKKGNAYVFKRNSAGKWLKEAKLGNNTTGISLANGDVFGHSVAIDGSRLAVGAACDDGASGSDTGAVYILKRSGSTWTLEQEISDVSSGFDHLDVNNQLGYFKVILDDDSLIAGAGGHVGRSTQESSGAAYIFTKDDSHSWAVDSRFTDQTPENFSWRHKRTGTSSTCQATTFASGTIGTGFSVTIDRAADHDDYLCFEASNDRGMKGYGSLQMKIAGPKISFSQDQDSVDASARDTGSGSLTIDSATWAHSTPGSTDPGDCSGATYNTAGSTENTVSVSAADNNDWVCFRVKNSGGAYGYGKYQIDFNAPVVTVTKTGTTLTASSTADDLAATNPYSKTTGYANLINCTTLANSKYSNGNQITTAANNHFYCFRAVDDNGNYGYARIFLGKTSNMVLMDVIISTSQDQDSLDASATSQNGTIDTSTWAHSTPNSTDPGDCSGATYNTAGSTENTVAITSAENNKYVCFKVSNSLGTSETVKAKIDFNAPTVTVSQNNTTLTGSAIDTGVGLPNSPVFKHTAALNTPVSCDSSRTYATESKTVTGVSHGQRYCFSVKDAAGNVGYGGISVDLTPPTITLTQTQESINASATSRRGVIDSSTWAHSDILPSNPTCSSDLITYKTAGATENTVVIDSDDGGNYVCFKVKNSLGVTGYVEWTIDFTAPTVTVSQNGSTVTASATDAGSGLPESPVFKHTAALNTTASCDSSRTYATESKTVTGVSHGQRYCFSVKDVAGNTGYGGINVDLTPPGIIISQNPVAKTLTMSSNQTLSRWDWRWSGGNNNFSQACSVLTYNASSTKQSHTLTMKTNPDKDYYCFKATNTKGVAGYLHYRLDLIAPTVTVSQNGSSLTYSASDADNAPDTWSWQYLTSSGPVGVCSGANPGWANASSGQPVTVTDDHYYCFRTKDTRNNYGYSSLQVDLTAPTITLSQDQDSVDATAVSPVKSTVSVSNLTETAASNNCQFDGSRQCALEFTTGTDSAGYSLTQIEAQLTAPTGSPGNLTVKLHSKNSSNQPQPTALASLTGVNPATAGSYSYVCASDLTNNCYLSPSTSYFIVFSAASGDSSNYYQIKTTASNDQSLSPAGNGFSLADDSQRYSSNSWTTNSNSLQLKVAGQKTTNSSTVITASTWAHSDILTSNPTSCSSGVTYDTAGSTEDEVTVDSGDDGDHVCFKVANSLGVYGYAKWTIDFTAPTVTVSQAGSTLTAASTDSDVVSSTWSHSGALSSDPTCSDSSVTYTNASKTKTSATDGKYYCFKVADDKANLGYGKILVNLTPPVISLSQDQNSVDATATMAGSPTIDSATWAHSDILTSNPTSCSSGVTYDTAGSTENTAPIGTSKSTEDGDWVCFKVANSLGVYGYAKWTIDFTAPNLTVSQNNTTVTAASTATDLHDSPRFKQTTAINDKTTTCNASLNYNTSSKTITSAVHNKRYCFSLEDKAGNLAYAGINVNLTKPTLTLVQENDKLKLSPTTGLSDIGYFTSSSDPDCDGDDTYTAGATTTAMTDDHWACFKAKNSVGVYNFAEKQIDLTTPVISLSQDQNSVDATATMAGSPTIDSDTWAHSDILTSNPTSCSSGITYDTAGSTEDEVTVDSGDDGNHVCFKVANSLGVYGYAKWTIDFTAPTVTVSQAGSTLTAASTDSDAVSSTWKHSGALSSDPTCSDSSVTYTNSGKTKTSATDGKYYCFRVADNKGNLGYGKILVNLTTPVISLSQDQDSVDASATMAGSPTIDTSTWAHSNVLTSNPTCSGATYNTAGSTENTAPIGTSKSTEDGDWVCFKVANSLGVYGYAKWTIDFTAPTVTVSQAGSTVTASATDAGVGLPDSPVFKHTAALNTTASCNSSQTYSTASATISSVTTGKRYCFQVKDKAGNIGYGGINVNLTTPVISLSQDQDSVDATATMAGSPTIDTSTWAHSNVLISNPTCSGASYNTAGSSENTAAVDSGDDGDWVCFKVANSLGVYSYAKWTIDFTAPTVTVSQAGSTVTASATDAGVGLPDSPVFKHTAALNTTASCNSSQTYSTASATISSVTTGKRYCFQVKDKAGNIGYGGINVNLTAPVISLSQDQDSVDATATMAGSPTIDSDTWAHSDILTTDLTCSSATYNTAGSTENTAPIGTSKSTEDGDWVCFKVANSLGVYGYAKWTIDFTAPTVTVSQAGSTLTAASTDSDAVSSTWKHSGALSSDPTCSSGVTYANSGKTKTSATTGKYYCFKVADNKGNLGYGKILVNLTTPVISLSQDQNSVDATATMAGSPTIDSDTWAHSDILTTDLTCSSATYNTAGSTENTAPIGTSKSTEDGDHVCFKVANSLGVYGYAKWTIDFTAPTVTVSQAGSTLTAASTDSDVAGSTWKHSGALSSDPTCSSGVTYSSSGKTKTSATTGKYYCFRVADNKGNLGYGKILVNLTTPVISLSQDQNSVDATATMAGSPTIDSDTWAHSDILTSNPTSCSSGVTYDTAGSTENTAPIGTSKSTEDGDWVCFKVANSLGVYGYAKWTIDFTAPTVTVSQAGSTLTATSTDSDVAGSTWKHSGALDSDPTCSSGVTYANSGKTKTSATTGKYYCFRVADNKGNLGYGKILVNLTTPVISLSQDQNSVDATATMAGSPTIDSATWAHSDILISNPTCSGATYNTAGSTENTAPIGTSKSTEDGDWVCFKVANSLGVYGYAKWTIDFTAPTVTVSQAGSTLTAASTDSDVAGSTWKHSGALSSDPTCSSGVTYSNSGKTKTSATTGKYYCFRVADNKGNLGYGKILANLNQPTITLTQDQNSVDATATMAGSPTIDSDTWAHSNILTSNPTCSSSSTTYDTAGSTENTAPIGTSKSTEDGDWVCFKVANSLGVYGYAKWTIDFTAPTVTVSQTGSTLTAASTDSDVVSSTWKHSNALDSDPTCSDSSVTYTNSGKTKTSATDGKYYCFRVADNKGNLGYGKASLDTTAPSLTLVQANDRIKLSSTTGLSDIKYFTAATDPDCDADDDWDNAKRGSTTGSMTDNHWACFRAKNSNDIYGYADLKLLASKRLIEIQAPVTPAISLTQTNRIVTASGSDILSWAYRVNPPAGCRQGTSFSDGRSGFTATAKDLNHNDQVCFRALGQTGLYGYASLTVNLSQPDLSVSQNQSRITAAAGAPAATTIQADSWASLLSADSNPISCNADSSYSQTGVTARSITITPGDNNRRACFKVANNLGVYGYQSYQVDYNSPVVKVSQDGTTVRAVSTAVDLDPDNPWHYSLSSTEVDCAGLDLDSWRIGNSVDNARDKSFYCFRATDNKGNPGYGRLLVDLTPPTVTISQNQTQARAQSPDRVDTGSWANFMTDDSSQPDCSNSSDYGPAKTDSQTVAVNSSQDQLWLCFRVANQLGVYGFNQHQIDFQAPGLTVTRVDSDLKVSSSDSDLSDEPYAYSQDYDSQPDCAGLTDSDYSAGDTVSNAADGQYYCFRVSDQSGNQGYDYYQVPVAVVPVAGAGQADDQPVAGTSQADDQPVATQIGSLTANIINGQLSLGYPGGLNNWQYVILDPGQSCNAGAFSGNVRTGTVVNLSAIAGNRICFRATDSNGLFSYYQTAVLNGSNYRLTDLTAQVSSPISSPTFSANQKMVILILAVLALALAVLLKLSRRWPDRITDSFYVRTKRQVKLTVKQYPYLAAKIELIRQINRPIVNPTALDKNIKVNPINRDRIELAIRSTDRDPERVSISLTVHKDQ